ncbi:mariner transposase [Elysia marginata]|uniref:Mariner transposase n=1 Tax=Elysia marginata TaxID=1093978 RepID=A0AAV4HE17_9GAST|nr:mariner transposase [Elysia marginata]
MKKRARNSFSGLSQGMSPGYTIMTLRANISRWNTGTRFKSSPSPRKSKLVASARKVMLLTVSWDSEGTVHIEFLKQENTVNSERYISMLRKLNVRLKHVRPTKHAILHHDNARPHTIRQTEEALHKIKLVALPHPSYSRDLALSDFYLFQKFKKHLRGNHYESDEHVEVAVRHWFRQKCVDFFTNGTRQPVRRLRILKSLI